jgi:hypothetical protein
MFWFTMSIIMSMKFCDFLQHFFFEAVADIIGFLGVIYLGFVVV